MKPRRTASHNRYMTAKEVAGYMRIHVSTVYKLIRDQRLPGFKIGGDWRFDKAAIDKWFADRKKKKRASAS